MYSVVAQPWAEVSSSVAPNFYRMKTSGDAALNAVKSQKGKGFKAFKRWEKYWDQRVFSDGSFPPANLVQKNWELYQFEKSLSALIPGSSWTSLGPNSSSGGYAGIGRINRLTFHPTNTSIIFACTAGGGLWKTTNGGTSWVPLTDNLASIGTSGLVINPTDPNIMYLATGDGDGADTYSYGVLKSTDGGVTWNTTGLTFTTGTVIYKLQQHATDPNILLAGTNGGLYRTANGGTSWTKVVASGQFYDIEALSATNMVAVTKGGFYRSTDSGATWVLVTTIASTGRIALAVSASNPNFVAALVSNTSNGFKGFYASVDGGLTYTLRSSTPNLMGWETNGSDSGGQAWYDLCMAVSPTDVNQIIVGGVNTWKSNNGGVSWSIMTNWYQTSTVPAMHADQHDLIFLNSTTIYAANDGGIYRSTNNGVSWTDLTNGMSISQLYRAGASQTDTRIIAGLQDNGTKLRSTTGTWSDEIGGDGMDCAIDPTNASFMYGTLYYGDIQRSTNGGSSWTSITPSTGTDGAWVSPVLLDPVNPATIYLGYKDLMKSTDRGTTWSKITAGQTGGNFISNIAVAPSDPSVIYISWGTALAKTINGGSNWTTITAPISSQISSLMVDPTNPNNLYATYSNFTAGSKVYFSNNGGTSWTNISGTLPNIPANKIIYQTGSNGALYLGMDVGIYYRDNTQTDWSLYNSGLPNVEIFDLEIRYSDKKLIAATYGRGLWESPLYVGTTLSVPAVSSFSPTSATKGNTVTITGSNFNGVSSVSFGGTAANSFTVVSSTSINAIVGNGNSGNVTVTNSAGTGSLSGFTYINTAPTISSFTPTSGKTGQVVNIIGTNFTGATAVSFGGTAATTYTVVSATSINATVGAGTSGTVSVTTASGTGTLAGFTYLPPPTIASFSPISAGTGQTVTITGTNFTGATAVSLGGTAATSFTVVSATSITAVVGAGATGSVSVTTANGIASRAGFTFITATPAPTISSFTPTSGKTGQVVNIIGTNVTGATAVSFGGTAATTFTVVSATSINATLGAGASGTVSVTTASGTGTLAGFTYLPPPTITSFSPTSAGTGQTVTITGTNFTGATAVSLGGTAATSFTVVSATSITAVVGTGATGSVSVTTSNGIGSRAGFTFISATPAPAISSFTPTSGNTGQVVTITGTNFTGATAVSFGGTAATTFTVLSATSINATVGAGTSGTVLVTTASGSGILAGFTYLPPPTITSFSPTSGKTGQVVTITGTNFTGATAVSFGGTAATSFTVVSATSITAVVGTGKTGNVRVVTANGAITKSGFIYLAPPTISSFSPTSAGTGQTVTISGTNFTGGTIVSFGGTPATSFTVVSATSITAVVGAGATGSVSVTTSNGIDSRAGFTFISATTAPAISSFTPTSGKTGQVVTITGTNFTGATAVSFGGTAATSFAVVSATSINA
ncbi:MAG: beta strand repeat-containing protein, partial [Bacteroidota bacterium]